MNSICQKYIILITAHSPTKDVSEHYGGEFDSPPTSIQIENAMGRLKVRRYVNEVYSARVELRWVFSG